MFEESSLYETWPVQRFGRIMFLILTRVDTKVMANLVPLGETTPNFKEMANGCFLNVFLGLMNRSCERIGKSIVASRRGKREFQTPIVDIG